MNRLIYRPLSDNEDADLADTIIKYQSQQVVYNASLGGSKGSKDNADGFPVNLVQKVILINLLNVKSVENSLKML